MNSTEVLLKSSDLHWKQSEYFQSYPTYSRSSRSTFEVIRPTLEAVRVLLKPTKVLSLTIGILLATNHELTTSLCKRYDVLKNIFKEFPLVRTEQVRPIGQPPSLVLL